MSGYKHTMVSISEEEYRRLHDMAMKKKYKESKQHDREEENLKRINEQMLQALQEQERDFDACLASLEGEVGRLELDSQQKLQASHAEMIQDLLGRVGNLWQENSNTQALLVDFDTRMQGQIASRDLHMEQTDRILHQIAGDHRSKYDMAASWIASAISLVDYIDAHYDHNRFTPGRFMQICRDLDMAQANLENGIPETALACAQAAYLKFSDLRLDLEEQTQTWELLHQVTLQAATDLYDMVRENSTCCALDLDGNELPFTLHLNYWSRGAYSAMLGRIKSIILWLREKSPDLSVEILRTCLDENLAGIKKEFDALLFAARLSAINSQIRINIADLSVQALEGQGFALEESGYSQGDRRNPFILNLRNIEGSQVTIKVDPLEDSGEGSDLSIISRDKDQRTEHELRQRSQEILRALLQYGLRVGPLQVMNSVLPKDVATSEATHKNIKRQLKLKEVDYAGTD